MVFKFHVFVRKYLVDLVFFILRYVALIQSGSQRLSEMREKLKVLENEVDILKLESKGKDKTILEKKNQVHRQRTLRDQCRMELTKVVQTINSSNDTVEL